MEKLTKEEFQKAEEALRTIWESKKKTIFHHKIMWLGYNRKRETTALYNTEEEVNERIAMFPDPSNWETISVDIPIKKAIKKLYVGIKGAPSPEGTHLTTLYATLNSNPMPEGWIEVPVEIEVEI